MKNPFKRWLRSAEYRELDERISELGDLYTVLAERFKRWDSRQRQRAHRGLIDDSEPAPIGARDPNGGSNANPLVRDGDGSPVADGQVPKFTKDQLRSFGRARGIGI